MSYEKNEIEISPDVGYFTVENLENGKTYEFALAAQKAGNLTSDLVKVTATPGEILIKFHKSRLLIFGLKFLIKEIIRSVTVTKDTKFIMKAELLPTELSVKQKKLLTTQKKFLN